MKSLTTQISLIEVKTGNIEDSSTLHKITPSLRNFVPWQITQLVLYTFSSVTPGSIPKLSSLDLRDFLTDSIANVRTPYFLLVENIGCDVGFSFESTKLLDSFS